MSVEEDWRAAFKFFVERVQREDWTEENYPDNIRWKIDDPSPERVEKLRAARPVEIGENDYKGLYECEVGFRICNETSPRKEIYHL